MHVAFPLAQFRSVSASAVQEAGSWTAVNAVQASQEREPPGECAA